MQTASISHPFFLLSFIPPSSPVLPVDRCADSANPCPDPNAQCEDVPEGARCVCVTGYVLADDETCDGQSDDFQEQAQARGRKFIARPHAHVACSRSVLT